MISPGMKLLMIVLLLQILEDGVLTDGQGNKIKFNNTIVILTSNLGSADMLRESELGFTAKTAKDKKALAEETGVWAKEN